MSSSAARRRRGQCHGSGACSELPGRRPYAHQGSPLIAHPDSRPLGSREGRLVAQLAEHLVGRAGELGAIDAALDAVERGGAAAVELVGEPGIGKTRLLAELARRADRRGWLVLTGSASELERSLPFWIFVDALDVYVRSRNVDASLRARLGHVLPAFAAGGGGPVEPYLTHVALRELLELLAAEQPLAL